jgi:4-amino-4-deoxy-L-arabinose transferase-like glycosyltransferase
MVALATLLVTPLLWTTSSLTWGNEGGWPAAGPQFAQRQPVGRPLVDSVLIHYLEAHRGRSKFLVATVDAYLASPLIIATGQPVMVLGGFSGRDPVLGTSGLARVVARGDVRLFLVAASNVTPAQAEALFENTEGTRQARGYAQTVVAPVRYTNALTHWVSDHCAPVPPSQWSAAKSAAYQLGPWALFTCQ